MKTKASLPQSIADFFARDTLLPVILCIGSDKVTGDALGPITGELLTRRFNVPCFVYGTLRSTVTALNLDATLAFIRSRHPSRRVIAVDSGLGNASCSGDVRFGGGGLLPGRGVGKSLPLTGDFSVLGVVAKPSEAHLLGSLPLGKVYSLAEKVASRIAEGVELIVRERED